MKASKFKVGSKVLWTCRGPGSVFTRRGTVVAVVPAGTPARSVEPKLKRDGAPRDHESYVVAAASPTGKGQLYWPRVAALAKA